MIQILVGSEMMSLLGGIFGVFKKEKKIWAGIWGGSTETPPQNNNTLILVPDQRSGSVTAPKLLAPDRTLIYGRNT